MGTLDSDGKILIASFIFIVISILVLLVVVTHAWRSGRKNSEEDRQILGNLLWDRMENGRRYSLAHAAELRGWDYAMTNVVLADLCKRGLVLVDGDTYTRVVVETKGAIFH